MRTHPSSRPGNSTRGDLRTRRDVLRVLGLAAGAGLLATLGVRSCGTTGALDEPKDDENTKRIAAFEAKGLGPWRAQLAGAYVRSGEYRPYIDAIFEAQRLPPALADLAFAESFWTYRVSSPVGAEGLFQFMPATGREYGMRIVGGAFDERCDPILSALGAANYLRKLRKRYASSADAISWALTAYNYGMGNVDPYFRATGGDYARYDEALAQGNASRATQRESGEYVPKIHGLRDALFQPGGIVATDDLKAAAPLQFDIVTVSYEEQFDRHVVRAGQTLGGIAASSGVTVGAIARANGLHGSRIEIGEVLRIPRNDGITIAEAAAAAGCGSDDLLAANHAILPGTSADAVLPNGLRLHVPPDGGPAFVRALAGRLTPASGEITIYRA